MQLANDLAAQQRCADPTATLMLPKVRLQRLAKLSRELSCWLTWLPSFGASPQADLVTLNIQPCNLRHLLTVF